MELTRFREGSPAGEVALRSQWESFQLAGTVDAGVRPEIAESWRRSSQADIATSFRAAAVDEAARRALPHAAGSRRRFHLTAAAVADELAAELGHMRAVVVVCDDFGIVLHRAGRSELLRSLEPVNLVPGGIWSERAAGTNGLGLALALGAAAHVHGAEHFLEMLHRYSCAAAVIRHPSTGETLGALGLTTAVEVPSALALGLVVRAGREVERGLHEALRGRERDLMDHHLERRSGRSAPLLTVDRSRRTVIQSAQVAASAHPEDISQLLEVAGRALQEGRDRAEELELTHGRMRAQVRLVQEDDETLGAHVAVRRLARPPDSGHAERDGAWDGLVGRSPAMQRLLREADRVARERPRVAIWGEAGSGKLSLARGLHRLGGTGALVPVSCALPDWDRELASAATGPATVVLRRIHALEPAAQLGLCDLLDELAEEARPTWLIALLGARAPLPCAELLSRLARVSLTMPPLRDRGHDLRLLVERWCDERAQRTGTRPALRADAHETLAAQAWPGNVRELHNALDAAALRAGAVIGAESLDLAPHAWQDPPADAPLGVRGTLRDLEHEAIDAALRRTGGNVSRAARELGIGRATLHRRLRAYRLLP